MKIKIKHGTFTGPKGEVVKPVDCLLGNRRLKLSVGDEIPSRPANDTSQKRFCIYANGTGSDSGKIRVSSGVWPTEVEANQAWQNGFEVADPRDRTEVGRLVAELLREDVAEAAD